MMPGRWSGHSGYRRSCSSEGAGAARFLLHGSAIQAEDHLRDGQGLFDVEAEQEVFAQLAFDPSDVAVLLRTEEVHVVSGRCGPHVELRQVDVQVGERVAQAFDATGVGVEPGAQIRGESGCGIGEGGPGGRGCRIDGCVHRSHATEQSRRSQERQP